MKSLSNQQVIKLAKCSNSTALEIICANLLESKKLYLNKKNNSSATIKWLEKNFDAKFTKGNDAPRGGKAGEFVTFEVNCNFEKLVNLISEADAECIKNNEAKKAEQQKAINNMVISETEKQSFLLKTKDMSNRKAREIAHNFAAKKLGFYSNQAKDKFMELR
jgi:hypothetical protein